jgi:Na+-transporting methylmalonyl-CoA/oxaloacetate decarboxylase gamma subunit
MSTAAIIPPPEDTSFLRRVPQMTARARALLTAMNLHFAGVAVLVLLDLYLIVHLVFVWQGLSSHNADAIDQQRSQLIAAEIAAKPLRGLDKKLVVSTSAADAFYQQRLPYATSEVAAELGALAKRQGVHLTRVQYAYSTVLSGNDQLVEDRMDASISGDYRPVVQFINAAERDKVFFVINGINLTGQQSGQVNLRLRMTTYLRDPRAGELTDAVTTSDANNDSAKGVKP